MTRSTETAMFPLQSVLLPGMPLGLQIFEPRYVRLLEDIEATGDLFGVVLITRGSEVGGQDQRADVGTMAHVRRRRSLGGDLWLLEAVGVERIQVVKWLSDDPYPKAETEAAPQPIGARGESAVDRARRQFAAFLTLASELGADTSAVVISDDPVDALYEIAATAPLAAYDRYRILASDTIADGAEVVIDAIGGAIEILRDQLSGG